MITEQELKGHWHKLAGKVKAKWAQLTDDDLARVEGNVEQLVGRIQQKTGEARRNIEMFLDESIKAGAPVMQAVEDAAEKVTTTAREGYKAAESRIQARPVESMAVVLGMGALLGFAIGLMYKLES
jgi:uncharacterized protein YjbJ (UPF0337 family)